MFIYHGTKEKRAKSIVNGKPTIKKFYADKVHTPNNKVQKAPGDLGAGFYAFMCDNSYENALSFANKRFPEDKSVCKIQLAKDEDSIVSLDLREPENINFLRDLRELIPEKEKENIFNNALNDDGYRKITLDGYLIEIAINFLAKQEKPVQIEAVIADSYTPRIPGPHFPSSKIPNGTEICIRSSQLIDKVTLIE